MVPVKFCNRIFQGNASGVYHLPGMFFLNKKLKQSQLPACAMQGLFPCREMGVGVILPRQKTKNYETDNKYSMERKHAV